MYTTRRRQLVLNVGSWTSCVSFRIRHKKSMTNARPPVSNVPGGNKSYWIPTFGPSLSITYTRSLYTHNEKSKQNFVVYIYRREFLSLWVYTFVLLWARKNELSFFSRWELLSIDLNHKKVFRSRIDFEILPKPLMRWMPFSPRIYRKKEKGKCHDLEMAKKVTDSEKLQKWKKIC